MDLTATTISIGYASGLNAYATTLILCLLGRAGVGDVPHDLTTNPILVGSAVMTAIEFFVDKVPYVDSAWDTIHTVIRPVIASLLGIQFADADHAANQVAAVGGATSTALLSHGIKAGLRLGINVSPEPFTNIAASLVEDVLAGTVSTLAVTHPALAVSIVTVLLAIGVTLVILLASRIRRAIRNRRARRAGRAPP
ncbi:MAG: hypothetical protein QOD60_2368 [Solirubrobacterales bacterium]|jgi:hypothetical protein|nr:hypothetical protein [Solirubrobacterales bacterium]